MNIQNLLNWLLNESGMSKIDRKKYLARTQIFYCESLKYILTKMDLFKILWKHVIWINFMWRKDVYWTTVEFFWMLTIKFTDLEKGLLYNQFVDFKILNEIGIPEEHWKKQSSMRMMKVVPNIKSM